MNTVLLIESDFVILGGGWAGLLCARKALDIGINKISLIDKMQSTELGGLLKTETIDGFTFDCGGPHLLFSRDHHVLSDISNILGSNCSKRERNNFVLYDNQYIPYPFENGVYLLNPQQRVKFIEGVIERMFFVAKNERWVPSHFLDWITGFFGDYMANEYLIPYNKKIWKRPLDKMAADWVFAPGRLPFPELKSMLLTVAGIPNVGYKEQAYFYYPNSGGISALFDSLFDTISKKGAVVIGGEKVTSVKRNTNGTYTINDKIIARRIVNTIPLPELLLSLDDGNKYNELAGKFDYNSVVIVGVAIRMNTPNQTTVYVPDPKILFHRYTWMSSLIPSRDGKYSNLIAEVTVPKGEMLDLNKIKKGVIRGLIDTGVIADETAVLFTKVWCNKYGYPIYSLNHNEIRKDAFHILDDYGVKTVGRWGSWHYWNTDMVYKAVSEMNLTDWDNNGIV